MQATKNWNIVSPSEEGLHEVVTPEKTDCKFIWFYRLNLKEGSKHILDSKQLEMNPVLVNGSAYIKNDDLCAGMQKLDSFYIPASTKIEIEALSDCIFYIPAATYEGIGKPFFRKYDNTISDTNILQVHGHKASRREVFFTVNPEVPASRLICGFAFGGEGTWTSWPPHQHSKSLEEIYCYFDMKDNPTGIQFSYMESGGLFDAVLQKIANGHIVLIPQGYHPTLAVPGTKNTYLWAMAANRLETRRYDLSVPDPYFENFK
jgi:5-deoxy-glucuronate isomerase